MKLLATFLLAIGLAVGAHAQHGDSLTISGAGAFTFGTAFIDQGPFPVIGGRGGMLINERFLIGGGGASGWGTAKGTDGGPADFSFGYGGLLLGWWPMPNARVRPMVDVIVGSGGYQKKQQVGEELYRIRSHGGFAFDGEAGLAIRMNRYIRLTITAGWRAIDTHDRLLDTPSIAAGLWLGGF